jgi:hypothetical protein
MKGLALLSITLLALACSRGNAPSGSLPPTAETAKKLAEGAVAAANPHDPKVLITDDKVSRYIVYQKEINTVGGLVMGAAVGAYNKSGGDQKGFEKALSQDERTKKIAEAQASALSKSGLTQVEAMEIGKVVSTYTPGATMGDAEMKKQAREEFSAKYGATVLAVLEKRLPELEKLQDEMLNAVLGKKK